MANIKRKQIAFNLDDPYQKQLYDFTEQYKNFSYYGKTLIQKAMENKPIQQISFESDYADQNNIEIDDDIVKGFI